VKSYSLRITLPLGIPNKENVMKKSIQLIVSSIGVAAVGLAVPACTEEVAPSQPQAQTQPASEQQAVMDAHASQGGGSALGGAKRASEGIIQQAEQQSQQVADQAEGND
jgi:hypothetical protein